MWPQNNLDARNHGRQTGAECSGSAESAGAETKHAVSSHAWAGTHA